MSAAKEYITTLAKIDWNTQVEGGTGASRNWPVQGWDAVNAGNNLRIANALERIATALETQTRNATELRNARTTNRRLRTQIRNLKAKKP